MHAPPAGHQVSKLAPAGLGSQHPPPGSAAARCAAQSAAGSAASQTPPRRPSTPDPPPPLAAAGLQCRPAGGRANGSASTIGQRWAALMNAGSSKAARHAALQQLAQQPAGSAPGRMACEHESEGSHMSSRLLMSCRGDGGGEGAQRRQQLGRLSLQPRKQPGRAATEEAHRASSAAQQRAPAGPPAWRCWRSCRWWWR